MDNASDVPSILMQKSLLATSSELLPGRDAALSQNLAAGPNKRKMSELGLPAVEDDTFFMSVVEGNKDIKYERIHILFEAMNARN